MAIAGEAAENEQARSVPPLPLISKALSRAGIADVCAGSGVSASTLALQRLASVGAISGDSPRSQAVATLGNWLASNRRSEYVYKNTIANKVLFGKHSPRTTALLQEFRVGRSKIDSVVVNGKVQAYEIKTELDSPSKLPKQISDYRQVFPLISVVTHSSVSSRYESLFAGTSIGVMALTRAGTFSTRKEAVPDYSQLSSESMMRSLRKSEYSALVAEAFGSVPDVPNTLFFRACLDRVGGIPIDAMFELWADQLRKRKLRSPEELSSEEVRPIRHVCAEVNPDRSGVARLQEWLENKVSE